MSDEEIQQLSTDPAPEEKSGSDENALAQAPYDIFRRYYVLVDTSLTVSKLLLLSTVFLTVFLSWQAGANPIWIAIRAVVVTVAMGLVLWLANYIFNQQVMDTVMVEVDKVVEKVQEQAPVSTLERQA